MFNYVFWPLVIGLVPIVLSIPRRLIAGDGQVSTSAPGEIIEGPVEGGRSCRPARCRRSPSGSGPRWSKELPGRMRIDGPERKRFRPVRLRTPSW